VLVIRDDSPPIPLELSQDVSSGNAYLGGDLGGINAEVIADQVANMLTTEDESAASQWMN